MPLRCPFYHSKWAFYSSRSALRLPFFWREKLPQPVEVWPQFRPFFWVRWYAAVLEHILMLSRLLGYCLPSTFPNGYSEESKEKIVTLLNKDLLREIDVLVNLVKTICEAPDSLRLQRNNLIYEVVRFVGEDYRRVQHEMSLRVVELRDRIPNLSMGKLTQFIDALKKLEDCRERLCLLFANRKRNDALWELISESKLSVMEMIMKKETKSLVKIETAEVSSQLTPSGEQFAELGQLVRFNYGSEWCSFDSAP